MFNSEWRSQAAAKALTEMDCIPAPAPASANPKPCASDGRPQWQSAAQAQVPARQPGEDPAQGHRRVPRRRWAPLGPVDANAEPWRADPAAKPSPAARHGDTGAMEWGAAEAAGLRAWGAPLLQEQVPPGETEGRAGRACAHGPHRGLQGPYERQALGAGGRHSLDFGMQARLRFYSPENSFPSTPQWLPIMCELLGNAMHLLEMIAACKSIQGCSILVARV